MRRIGRQMRDRGTKVRVEAMGAIGAVLLGLGWLAALVPVGPMVRRW